MLQTSPDPALVGALFRLLAARSGFHAVALFAGEWRRARLVAASPGFHALVAAGHAEPSVPFLAGPGPARVPPESLGLTATFAAAAPVAGPDGATLGSIVVADARARRLSAGRSAELANAALLSRAVLAGAFPISATVHPRSAAQSMVEAALVGRDQGEITLMMLDLDRFGPVNDALGIATGDLVLAATTERLERALASLGRVVRLEGDRFLLVAAVNAAEAPGLGWRLLEAVNQPLEIEGRRLVVKASAGIVAGVGPGVSSKLLLTQADAALRRAKFEGRNRFVIHEPAQAVAAVESTRLELDLAGALAEGQLHLAYQPYIDLREGRVSGVEALLRWRHPVRGTLLPANFIPMAEANGHILPLGQWALRRALADAARWRAPLALAVNISPLQFQQPGFLAEIDAALAESGFPSERLELEITESVLVSDKPETTGMLRALIARGIRIALDDFGTGYSALAYLARLPHHRIKLDKAFLQDMASPATTNLIGAIISLARAQGVAVTAEGVERADQLALVRRMGFTHAQGYAIGAPVAEPSVDLLPDAQACLIPGE